MKEDTRAEAKRIVEMIYIYQDSVQSGDIDSESMELIKDDLKNKEEKINEIKREMEEELNDLYSNSSAIDPEVQHLENEINDINNSLEFISDVMNDKFISVNLHEEKLEQKIEDEIVNIPEIDIEPDVDGITAFSEELEQKVDLIEDNYEEVEPKENITEANDYEEYKEPEVEEITAYSQEDEYEEDIQDENVIETNDYERYVETKKENRKIVITASSEDYEKVAANIVIKRSKTIKNPFVALQKNIKASELIMAKIKDSFEPEPSFDSKQFQMETRNFYREDDERSL